MLIDFAQIYALAGLALTAVSGASTGEASYYADRFIGCRTASGERYNAREFTAAHMTFPFGTYVRVIRRDNGDSIIVRINDRGPYVRGRIIDLSKSAAQRLGLIARGYAHVRIEKVERTSSASQNRAPACGIVMTPRSAGDTIIFPNEVISPPVFPDVVAASVQLPIVTFP